jgi:exosortase
MNQIPQPEPAKKDASSFIISPYSNPWLTFAGWVAICLVLFVKPVYELFQLASQDDTASHIFLIPLISGWLTYTNRKQLKLQGGLRSGPALVFLVASTVLAIWALRCESCTPQDRLSVYILSFVLLLISGFILILGTSATKASGFALAFLLFMVPLPGLFLGKIIFALQSGSADIAGWIFDLCGVPALREGFVFHLPRMSIEVAQECSGIRSSIALLILALLVAHFSFSKLWKKVLFVIAGLAMMLIKNGVRIATLTILANYVDPDFLFGRLHKQGGVVFFLIGLALLLPVYWLLRRGEVQPPTAGARVSPV